MSHDSFYPNFELPHIASFLIKNSCRFVIYTKNQSESNVKTKKNNFQKKFDIPKFWLIWTFYKKIIQSLADFYGH
jgi:hypothetical protein